MRQITSHTSYKENGVNDALTIDVLDEPGSSGASHSYKITGYGTPPGYEGQGVATGTELARINFQKGCAREVGINGVSDEALLAIVIDRLQGFQTSVFKCRENALAITHLEDAMHWLQHRTRTSEK